MLHTRSVGHFFGSSTSSGTVQNIAVESARPAINRTDWKEVDEEGRDGEGTGGLMARHVVNAPRVSRDHSLPDGVVQQI